ncbi:hypothetical protein [Parapedobacter indicus]|nr:hypothetical protein [Parapedobacter indicus]
MLAMFICFGSCQKSDDEDIVPKKEEVSVTLSLKLPTLPSGLKTYTINEVDENLIEEVDVLVFKKDIDGKERFSYRATGIVVPLPPPNNDKAELTASLRRDEDTGNEYRLVILVNARQQLDTYGINLGETKESLQKHLIYEHSDKWQAKIEGGPFTPLPMWGETDLISGMNVPMIHTEEIDLLRSIVRVDVVADQLIGIFTLTEVHVYNSKSSGLIMPDKNKFENNEPSLPVSLGLPNNSTLKYEVSGNKLEREIYLFEATAGTANPDPTATALVIGGYYNADVSTPCFYRIDFKDAANNLIPLLRNHHYVINITGADNSGSPEDHEDDAFEQPSLPNLFLYWGGSGTRPNYFFERRLIKPPSQRRTEIVSTGGRGINYTITAIDETH